MNDLLSDLREQIQRRRVTVVVGAGVSIASSGNETCSSWTGLLHSGVERCLALHPELSTAWGERADADAESGDMGDLLAAAEKVTDKLGGRTGGEYRRWLRETVGSLKVVDANLMEALVDLGSPILTTNYDGLIEDVAGLPPVTWRDENELVRVLRGDSQAVVHLHGYWEDPRSVVLGLRSYDELMGHDLAQTVQRALALSRSLLLVGFGAGLGDPNFAAFRRWMREVLPESEARHYRLALSSEVREAAREHAEERVVVLAYGDSHTDLGGYLTQLRAAAPVDLARKPVERVARPRQAPATTPAPVTGTASRVATRLGTNREAFVERLAGASHVTVVGITNERLVDHLEEAFRRREGDESSPPLWTSVRIICLAEALLAAVDDSLITEYPVAEAATEERARRAGVAKRMISAFFLRQPRAKSWELLEYGYVPPFVGAILSNTDGRHAAQIATISPGQDASDYLYFEFPQDSPEFIHYQAVVERVVAHSTSENEVVLVGTPIDAGGFRCQHARFRRQILVEGQHLDDWSPAVIVALWQHGSTGAEPLLGVNTDENSTRDIGTLSHVSGYVNLQDCRQAESQGRVEFLLDDSAPANAARRELREELAFRHVSSKLIPVSEARFLYHDRQNLYFYVLSLEVDEADVRSFSPVAGIRGWALPSLLDAHLYQVLTRVSSVLRSRNLASVQQLVALDTLGWHLVLHKQPRLADAVRAAADAEMEHLIDQVDVGRRKYEQHHEVRGRQQTIQGFAGMQYREFFSTMLPLYASIGVPGAVEYVEWIASSSDARAAVDRLSRFYQDKSEVRGVGMEV